MCVCECSVCECVCVSVCVCVCVYRHHPPPTSLLFSRFSTLDLSTAVPSSPLSSDSTLRSPGLDGRRALTGDPVDSSGGASRAADVRASRHTLRSAAVDACRYRTCFDDDSPEADVNDRHHGFLNSAKSTSATTLLGDRRIWRWHVPATTAPVQGTHSA